MVYDCFTFLDNFDILEIRLNELRDVVDQFVVCESTHNFAGGRKPLFLSENRKRFSDFPLKILVLDEPDDAQVTSGNLFANEFRQKNYLKTALLECKDDDIIIMSDIDEIPFPSIVQSYLNNGWSGSVCTVGMFMGYYYLNVIQEGYHWGSTFITTWSRVKPTELFILRNDLAYREYCLWDQGYHFSYLGGAEVIKYKLDSFTHKGDFPPETFTMENIKKCLVELKDLFGREGVFKAHDINTLPGFPKYVLNNQEKFSHLLYH